MFAYLFYTETSVEGKYWSWNTFWLPMPRPLFQQRGWDDMMFFFKVKVLAIHRHHFGKCHRPHPGATPSNLRGGSEKTVKIQCCQNELKFCKDKEQGMQFSKIYKFSPHPSFQIRDPLMSPTRYISRTNRGRVMKLDMDDPQGKGYR